MSSGGRSLVLENILNNSNSSSGDLPEYSDALVAIEAMNDVIIGSQVGIATAVSAVRSTLEVLPVDSSDLGGLSPSGQFILGGSGFGLVKADGEQPSPVTREMAQRMDDLFEAMSPTQQGAVEAQIVGSSAVDIVGGLSAMGVFQMDAADPTDSNFMSAFDDLDGAAQRLVLKNADPLDLNSMNTVTDAMVAVRAIEASVADGTDSGSVFKGLVTDLRVALDAVSGDNLSEAGGFGIIASPNEPSHDVGLPDVVVFETMLAAQSEAQNQEVYAALSSPSARCHHRMVV